MKTTALLACAIAATAAIAVAETVTTQQSVTTTNDATAVRSTTAQPASVTTVQPGTVGTATVTSSQPTANVTVTQPAPAAGVTVTETAPAAGVTVTAPATRTVTEANVSPGTVTYETRAEAAYRAAGIPDDVIIKLRDYDIKVRDARIANDTALVKQYYTEQANLLTSQQINGIRTYLKANPVPATTTAAVTVWEDPAYVSVASPATVVNPTTIVTNEVRTPPVVTRQVQVPVVAGSVPVVVKDPVPVVAPQVTGQAVIKTETAPVNTITQTEEKVKIRTETRNTERGGSSSSSASGGDSDKKDNKDDSSKND